MPKPYECVKRAWHSDTHQPLRGSIIQEIFRIVNEIHKPATKRNKEWQEKLPVVVLKVEEILFSKANSKAEYMDLETLWERMNDAIDTIIRRDESTETGELIQPCIEAALHLGCTPVRASRSQMNSNPRRYLSPRVEETENFSPGAASLIIQPGYANKNSEIMKSDSVSDSEKLACQQSNASTVGCLEHRPRDEKELIKQGVVTHDFFSRSHEAPTKASLRDHVDDHIKSSIDCDLSLQLGPLSASLQSPTADCSTMGKTEGIVVMGRTLSSTTKT